MDSQFNRDEVLSEIRHQLEFTLAARDDSVVIDICFQNGRAARAGLKSGDRIVGVDEESVSDRSSFVQAMGDRDLEKRVTLQVARGDLVLPAVIEPFVETPSPDYVQDTPEPITPLNRSTRGTDLSGPSGVANFFIGAAVFYFIAGLIGSVVVAYNSVHTTYLGRSYSVPGSGLHFVEVFAISFFLVCLFAAMLAFFGYVLKLMVELVNRLSR